MLLILPTAAGAADPLDKFLREGRIKDGLAAYEAPAGNAAKFSLGVLQVFDGLQKFSAGMHNLGIKPEFVEIGIPFFRVAAPDRLRLSQEPATPAKVAKLFQDFRAALRRANATLTQIKDEDFGVEVNLSQLRLDWDGDGQCATDETLLATLGQILGLATGNPEGREIVVRFDRADAAWLKGYTHLLTAMLDLLLAYDWRPVWDQCAHVVFLRPDPLPPMARYGQQLQDFLQFADLIAAIHDLRLNLVDKEGPRRARDEFKAMVSCSQLCWQRILAETDNDKEWLPSPKQTGPQGIKITLDQANAWQRVLEELEAVANGKKLLPHWRFKPGLGINVEKFVTSPPSLDLVLLIQGSAFIPYLEEGAVSDQATWRQLTRAFEGGFFRFAIWNN